MTFPLPHRCLSPNARVRWQIKFGLTKQAREQGRRKMFTAMQDIDSPAWCITGYMLRGYFKTKRHWDQDNLIASNKARIDGIADAARQDDKTFRCMGVETFTDTQNPRLEIVLDVEQLI